jgi:hypothetical protein
VPELERYAKAYDSVVWYHDRFTGRTMERIIRNNHFLGAKLRTLRKEHRITLDDLSARCAQIDPQSAPSVSYLSMIESGRRSPSQA